MHYQIITHPNIELLHRTTRHSSSPRDLGAILFNGSISTVNQGSSQMNMQNNGHCVICRRFWHVISQCPVAHVQLVDHSTGVLTDSSRDETRTEWNTIQSSNHPSLLIWFSICQMFPLSIRVKNHTCTDSLQHPEGINSPGNPFGRRRARTWSSGRNLAFWQKADA